MTTSNFLKHTSSNPIQKRLIENFYRQLIDQVCGLNPESVLDVGCGEGFTLNKLQNHRIGKKYCGLDISEQSLKLAQIQNRNIRFVVGSATRLPFSSGQFDLVLCNEVLEHLEEPRTALAEINRVSKKYCLFSVPNEPWFQIANFLRGKYLSTWGNHPEHIHHWSFAGFQKLLSESGFKILTSNSPFAWTLVTVVKT